jgi:hypothetical protein
MYLELKSLTKLPQEMLIALHSQIELFVSGSRLITELPKKLKNNLQKFSNSDGSVDQAARPMSKIGDHSLVSFTVIPPPNQFPDIEPHKTQALDILEEMRDIVYDSLKRLSSFEMFFNIISELGFADIVRIKGKRTDSREDIFWALCSTEKRKIDKLYIKLNEMQEKLQEIMIEMQKNEYSIDRKMLPDYIKSVEKHFEDMWEKVMFPHLIFYAYLIFGQTPADRPNWF